MACPNTRVMVDGKPKCDNQDFDPRSGLGLPETIEGVRQRVCEPCGLPKAETELQKALEELARQREDFYSIDFSDIERHLQGAVSKLTLWKKVQSDPAMAHLRPRVEDAVRQAYETARRSHWQLMEKPIIDLAIQAEETLRVTGVVTVDDKELQDKLDQLRANAEEAIALARADLEKSGERRISGRLKRNLLKDATVNARIAVARANAHQRRQTEVKEEAAIGRLFAKPFDADVDGYVPEPGDAAVGAVPTTPAPAKRPGGRRS